MSEPEIHDFMAVESFSQLPFIRSSPPQNNSSSSSSSSSSAASAIRLFGIDVPQENSNSNNNSSPEKSIATSNITAVSAAAVAVDPIRKFECHYCCRNFPTSQALGGHQNAHKSERQQAKQAHLQSAIAAHHYQYRLPTSPPARLNYYPNNNNIINTNAAAPPRLGLGSISQPINGNPLSGLWRVPHTLIHRDGGLQLPPLFRGEPAVSPNFTSLSAPPNSSSSSINVPTSTSNRLVYVKRKENVSLDLHL